MQVEMQVHNVRIDSITIKKDRFREEIDPVELDELKASIESIGLLHPIIIEADGSLVTGQRRVLAYQALGRKEIPALYRNDLDPLTRKIVEYDENKRRANFTWQEDAKAIAEIHALRKTEDTSWTYQKTADELGLPIAKIHSDVELNNAIAGTSIISDDGVKRILNRPTKTGAMITLKREKEAALLKELARRRVLRGEVIETAWSYNDDAKIVLAEMLENSVDLIITDPPWLIEVDQSTQTSKLKTMGYDDTDIDNIQGVLVEMFRVLKPGRHCYCFVSADQLQEWYDDLKNVGFGVRSRPLIWVKESWHSVSDPYRRIMTGYDAILWCYKPDDQQSWRNFITPVIEIDSFPRPTSWHPAAKPVDLLKKWVEASSLDNEIILDPFAGSGATLIAAHRAGRQYIGIERDPATYQQMVEDVENERS